MAIYFEWYVLGQNKAGRETKRKLRWRMTEATAEEWQRHPDNQSPRLERAETPGEDRGEGAGYIGWGQALPGTSDVEAAKRLADRWKPKREER